jgi:acylphosphatase
VETTRVRFLVTGRVQGVAYRASAQREAQRGGLLGWIRNLPDGSVEGIVEGPPARVRTFLASCARGPVGARVDDLVEKPEPTGEPFASFEIRR